MTTNILGDKLKEAGSNIIGVVNSGKVPPSDEKLEEYLVSLEGVAERYVNGEDPFGEFKLSEEDLRILQQTVSSLRTELQSRSSHYKDVVNRSPLEIKSFIKESPRKVETAPLQESESNGENKVESISKEGEIIDPYSFAVGFLDAAVNKSLSEGKIKPSILKTTANGIRKFDFAAMNTLEIFEHEKVSETEMEGMVS